MGLYGILSAAQFDGNLIVAFRLKQEAVKATEPASKWLCIASSSDLDAVVAKLYMHECSMNCISTVTELQTVLVLI